MTLDDLRYALYLNNLQVLDRIKALRDIVLAIQDTDMSNLNNFLTTHVSNLEIHVTKEDKELWNSILDNAKDYAKQLFQGVSKLHIEIVEELPTEPTELTIYFIPVVDEDNNVQDFYDEYMFINGKWEIIGHTYVDLTPYLQREEFEKIIANYVTSKELATILLQYAKTTDLHAHTNKSVLDKLSEDGNGILLFNNQTIESGSVVTDEEVQLAILSTLAELNADTNEDFSNNS